MIISRKLSLFLCTLLALGGVSHTFAHVIPTEQSNENLELWYKNTLNQEEKDLRTELCTLVDIKDQQEWEHIKQTTHEHYEQVCSTSTAQELAHKPLPPIIVEAIYSVLHNTKIRTMLGIITIEKDATTTDIKIICKNRSTITIACANNNLQADAASDEFAILIDPDVLLATHATSEEIQETIAHEIMHIIHEDDFNVFCFDTMYKKRKKRLSLSRKKFTKAKHRWERVQEKRADILSGLVDITYAQANRNHFYRTMPTTHDRTKPTTHPTDRQRYEYMNELVQAMLHNAQKNNNAPLLALISLLILCFLLMATTAMIRNKRAHA